MSKIYIFDPALCCSSGVCGVEVDEVLVKFAADIEWYRQQGGHVERYNLSQQPMAFVENSAVSTFLAHSGEQALPLILMSGEKLLAGRYPTREELAHWGGIELSKPLSAEVKQQPCCQSSGCC